MSGAFAPSAHACQAAAWRRRCGPVLACRRVACQEESTPWFRVASAPKAAVVCRAAGRVDKETFDLQVNVNKRIQEAPSVPAIFSEAFDNFEILSPVNFATALTTIAKKARRMPKEEQRQLVTGPAFRELVAGAVEAAPFTKPRDLSNILWALGTLKYSSDAVMKRFAAACATKVEDFSTRDISNALWAFGCVRYHPGPFLDLAASQLARSLDSASNQDLVMAVTGYGELRHDPGPLADACVARVTGASMGEEGSPQLLSALSKMLARLDIYRAEFWAKMEEVILTGQAPIRETANIYGAMALARHQPPAAVADAVLSRLRSGDDPVTGLDVAQVVHACAVLRCGEGGSGPEDEVCSTAPREAMAALVHASIKDLQPREVGLCAWALAVTDVAGNAEVIRALMARLESPGARLRDDTLRQVMQVLLLCSGAGVAMDVDASLRQAAVQTWMAVAASDRPGPVTVSLARVLEALGLNARTKVRVMDGMLVVEAACKREDGALLAIEVVWPKSVAVNTGHLLGSYCAKAALLRGQGWAVEYLMAEEWLAMAWPARVDAVASRLTRAGFALDPAKVAAVRAEGGGVPGEVWDIEGMEDGKDEDIESD